ncbi:hypothetical protein, partial [Siminovitchia fortis]|uniref:hypothetical protein n=1 Tax=Siminovitchia fortis TaxID=254758 RepID=UPI001C93016A
TKALPQDVANLAFAPLSLFSSKSWQWFKTIVTSKLLTFRFVQFSKIKLAFAFSRSLGRLLYHIKLSFRCQLFF